jgi:hypothetical protein
MQALISSCPGSCVEYSDPIRTILASKDAGEKKIKKIGVKKGIPNDGLREESLKEATDRGGKLGLEEAAAHHNQAQRAHTVKL